MGSRLHSLIHVTPLDVSRKLDFAVCGTLIVVSAALRSTALDPSSYIYDDAWVALSARADSVDEVIQTGFTTPLFNHTTGLIIRLFGDRILFAQALPFIAGSVFAGLAYLALRSLKFDQFAAIAASLIAVFSPTHILYSTRLKHFTVEALMVGVLIYLALQIVYKRTNPRTYVILAAVGTLVSATIGLTALPVLAVVFVVVSIDDRRINTTIGLSLVGLASASMLYWMFYLRPSVPDILYYFWRNAYIETDSISVFLNSLRHRISQAFAAFLPYAGVWWIVLISTVITVRNRWRDLLMFSAPVVVTMLMASLELVPFGGQPWGRRIDIHLMASLIGVVALILHEVRGAVSWTRDAVAIGASVAVLLLGVFRYDPPFYPQEDIRPLVDYLETKRATERDTESSAVIVTPLSRYAFSFYTNSRVRISDSDVYTNGFTVDILDPAIAILTAKSLMTPIPTDVSRFVPEVTTALNNRTSVWLISSLWPGYSIDQQLGPILSMIESEGFTEIDRKKASGAVLIEYARSSMI